MRIAVFSDCYFPAVNGVVTSIAVQLEVLREMGHRVDLICPSYVDAEPEEPGVVRLWARPFPLHRREQMTFPWPPRALARIWATEYDVVHLQTPFSVGLLGVAFSRSKRLPRVFHHHTLWEEYVDYLPLPKGLTSRLSVALCRTLANGCQRIVAPSAEVRDRFRQQGVRRPIDVVPTGIRAELFQGGAVRPERAADERICLYIGRLAFEKSLDAVVRVFQRIQAEVPEARLWLVGDGPARSALEAQVTELSLDGVVRFFGFVPRDTLRDFIASAKVFLFASLTETQGLVLLEAQSGGVPVVAFRASGVNEAVCSGETGYLIEPGREEQMAAMAVKLIGVEEQWRIFSERAVQWAGNFSLKRMGEDLVCLYERAIEESRNREK